MFILWVPDTLLMPSVSKTTWGEYHITDTSPRAQHGNANTMPRDSVPKVPKEAIPGVPKQHGVGGRGKQVTKKSRWNVMTDNVDLMGQYSLGYCPNPT